MLSQAAPCSATTRNGERARDQEVPEMIEGLARLLS